MPQVPPVSGAPGLAEAVQGIFADGGRLAQAIPAFEARAAQREMAAAVAETFDQGGTLLVEAGTGTGKTLAYLVPALLSGQRVLVSTGTKNLQEQIFFKDLPVLRDALGIPFTATYMKGRGNYLCLHRLEHAGQAAEGQFDDPERGARLTRLRRWARTTETGDRAELDDLPDDSPIWLEVAATAETCLGTTCPRYHDCFVTVLRQRAAESDLVIVNHHLLCADASIRQSAYGEVIPPCAHAIIDEAHQLEDVATQYFGVSVSTYRLEELARDVDRLGSGARSGTTAVELQRTAMRVRDRSKALFGALFLLRQGAVSRPPQAGDERFRLTPGLLQQIGDEGADLMTALDALEAGLQLARPVSRETDGGATGRTDDDQVAEDLVAMARRAGELRDDLRFLLRASDPDFVYYLEARGRGLFIRASPIDVSTLIRETLLDRLRAVVLTSATLAVDGSFEYMRRRLGVSGARERLLPPEFDYGRQTVLYLPRRMPDPRSPAFPDAAAREIVEILRRTRGRAFVLFTSYAMLRYVQALAEPSLDYPLFVQGTAPRSALLGQFRSTPHAVLLATASFWQGVDVIGEALSCVIVDRLPFASPADPLTAARIEAVASAGGQPFSDFQVPLAILTLKQGLGRLIRHRDDRGVLSILDPRIRTMAYGERFLAAIPNAPVTSELDVVERFLRD